MFYWCGGDLPWLRLQSILTFQRYHPNWRIVLASPEEREVPQGVELMKDTISNPNLPPAARSDVWRWWALSEFGGFYADTDCIFVRSVESLFQGNFDAWLTTDLGTEVDDDEVPKAQRLRISIGVLAAKRGSTFFSRAYEIAKRIPPSKDYQSHGTKMLTTYWENLSQGVKLGQIPARHFYAKAGSTERQVKDLWNADPFGSEEYGIHFFGGSPVTQPYLGVTSADQLPQCWVRKAIEK